MKEKIYVIPGLMTDHRLWSRLVPHLDEYELVHTPIPQTHCFDEMVQELEAQFKDEKINLLGFSLGGYLASYYTLMNPKKVNRLFLCASTPSSTEGKDVSRRALKLEEVKQRGHVELNMEKAHELLEKREDSELAQTVVDMFNDLGHTHFVPQLQSTLNRKDLFGELKTLNLPIHLFYSKYDRLLNHNSIAQIMQTEHNFNFSVREGTSHNIPLEVPECLSKEIKAWMKK